MIKIKKDILSITSLSIPVFAHTNYAQATSATITTTEAKNIALKHASLKRDNVEFLSQKNIRSAKMRYSTDLSDSQWALIEEAFVSNHDKNFVKYSKLESVNVILYLIKTGYQWRLLPKNFQSYTAVWSFYRQVVYD